MSIESKRTWRQANKEHIKEYDKSYRKSHQQHRYEVNEVWKKHNPEKTRAMSIRGLENQRIKSRNYLAEIKSKPCTDCGRSYPPYVMDFDHVKPGKTAPVARYAGLGWYARLIKEIELCELVCSNCHRIRTHNRRVAKSS